MNIKTKIVSFRGKQAIEFSYDEFDGITHRMSIHVITVDYIDKVGVHRAWEYAIKKLTGKDHEK